MAARKRVVRKRRNQAMYRQGDRIIRHTTDLMAGAGMLMIGASALGLAGSILKK